LLEMVALGREERLTDDADDDLVAVRKDPPHPAQSTDGADDAFFGGSGSVESVGLGSPGPVAPSGEDLLWSTASLDSSVPAESRASGEVPLSSTSPDSVCFAPAWAAC
jgi:hypothetical protein